MTEINLRPWQAKAKNKCLNWFEKNNKRFVINAAPGAGKTICASVISRELISKNVIDKVEKTFKNKNTVFNPGITIAPMNEHIIEDYARNQKNRFIIKYGDPVSNGIIKFKPKNMVLVIKPIHKNLLKNHSLGLFIGDDMKLYLEALVTSGRKTSKQSRKSNQTKSRKKTIKKHTNYTDILRRLEKIKAQKFR